MPPASGQPQQEEIVTRERILRAGVSQFQAHGYHGTGVVAILSEARAPKGSFYYHFPGGKEQLAVEAVQWLSEEIDAFLDRFAASQAGGTAMALGMARYAASGLSRADSMRGSLVAVLAADAVPGSAAINTALNHAVAGWTGKLADGFAREGVVDPDARAKVALAIIEGATMLARIAGRPASIVELVAAVLVSSSA